MASAASDAITPFIPAVVLIFLACVSGAYFRYYYPAHAKLLESLPLAHVELAPLGIVVDDEDADPSPRARALTADDMEVVSPTTTFRFAVAIPRCQRCRGVHAASDACGQVRCRSARRSRWLRLPRSPVLAATQRSFAADVEHEGEP